MTFDFSPHAVFGGVVTAIWLYLIKMTGRAFMEWDRLLEVIQVMQAHGGTFRYLIHGLPGLAGPEIPIGHKIIRSIPATGKLIAYVEILGLLKVGGIFADAGGPVDLLEHMYIYDVLGKIDRSAEFSIESAEFDRQDWTAIGLGPTDVQALKEYFHSSIEGIFVRHYEERFATASEEPKQS